MNFMSYVAEVSRGWDKPNARDMGRMTSQPNAKGEMYILNDGIDMRTKFASMERRLEKLEMTNMQPVQAISQIPLQPMPCSICRSFEHLGEECPTIPAVREMFGDCNTYNSNWRDHPNFFWKPQPPQYQQPTQAPQQASNLEQAMMNLNKVMEDFVEAKKSINAQPNQRIDSVESSLNKKMDEVQNDLSQKIDNLQDSISRFANLNTVQEKENSPSQPYQNSKGINEVEAKEGESSMVKEVETVITLRSGKEVDLPTCKLEHKHERSHFRWESSISQRISQLLSHFLAHECHFAPKLHFEEYFAAAKPLFGTRVPFGSPVHSFCSYEMAAKPPHLKILQRAHHEQTCHSSTPISAIVGHISITSRSSNYACNISFQILGSQESIASNGARFGFETEKLWPFEDDCANHEWKCRTSILLLLDTFLKHFLELKLCIPYLVSKLGKSGLRNGYEMISKLRNGCEITSKLRNDLQIAKLTCEMEKGLQKHFTKPREVAKMPTEPPDHAFEEKSPAHPGITHTKPLTPFLTS
ncbi:hypothetical protein AAG906_031343 [Vitis piasezkii]